MIYSDNLPSLRHTDPELARISEKPGFSEQSVMTRRCRQSFGAAVRWPMSSASAPAPKWPGCDLSALEHLDIGPPTARHPRCAAAGAQLCRAAFGCALDEAAVRAHECERLASDKVPRRVRSFAEDALRLTASARIKAAHLRMLAIARLAAERPGGTTIEGEDER